MFDYLKCNYPLSNPEHNKLEFQTKSLGSTMEEYVILENGDLTCRRNSWKRGGTRRLALCGYTGMVRFYTYINNEKDDGFRWVEYEVSFVEGELQTIRRLPIQYGWENEEKDLID